MARYLRGAAIGMPVEVLERIRATSPSLLREALLGAISLTPKQEQVGLRMFTRPFLVTSTSFQQL